MIIHHFDEYTGRFIELTVSEEQIRQKREEAIRNEKQTLLREQALRRINRMLDSGACTPEHAVGAAYNAGHAIGSRQIELTELDNEVLAHLGELDDANLNALALTPNCRAFVGAVRQWQRASNRYEG